MNIRPVQAAGIKPPAVVMSKRKVQCQSQFRRGQPLASSFTSRADSDDYTILEHARVAAPLSAPPPSGLSQIVPQDRTFLLVKILPPSRRLE